MLGSDLSEKLKKPRLIFRLKGFTAEKRETVDVIGSKGVDYLSFGFLCEFLTVSEIPGFGLKTVFAVVFSA